MQITRTEVPINGKNAGFFTLETASGCRVQLCERGASVHSLVIPDRDGKPVDVVLGFANPSDGLLPTSMFLGATAGRVANRIWHGETDVAGQALSLAINDAPHHLHGGPTGFDKQFWSGSELPDGVLFKLVSPAGHEGYPGTLSASVRYRLSEDEHLIVEMEAETDAATLVNFVHHSYWNLSGHDSGTILDHELEIYADQYTSFEPATGGRLHDVAGTPYDLRKRVRLGGPIERLGEGFDDNFVVRGQPSELRPVCHLRSAKTGINMQISANQPGVQLYTGRYLDGTIHGKGGIRYPKFGGLCLETQAFPYACNVPAWRGQVELNPGQRYVHRMDHAFSRQ